MCVLAVILFKYILSPFLVALVDSGEDTVPASFHCSLCCSDWSFSHPGFSALLTP